MWRLLVVVAVFDCLPHSLLIAKVHAYGFDKTSTEYLKDYLSHCKLKIKIYKTFSNWTNILHGVTQGSILGPLIFTVFLFDLFLFKPNIDLYGTKTVTYRGPQIWNLVPEKTQNASSFDLFKKEIGKRKGEKCPCRIYKTYIQHVGFIWKNCIRILFSSFTLLFTLSFTFLLCFLWEEGFWLVHMLLVFCNRH